MDDTSFFERTDQLKRRLYRIAFGYLGNENSALEAVDEAIFRGYGARKKLRRKEFFETWMTRILINVCKKELKRGKRETSVETIPEQAREQYDALPLKEAVRRLPEELRSVVVLRYYAGLTVAETAQRLGIPQGTAATRQRRALELLRLELKEDLE
ncbi:RNA polymerase sigma factor SigV [Caprobacter fermentans]|uniref:RNA polymerase sigma factor SigV n=1 Tax=Caproicibacter fermentans TaxID=2576756 RepID=A0A6N8HYT0_9FIRM|nr:RNA polymerase sigma factor SigV [Caproicibacter fermentans]OCN03290.1 RNA polymerase subunit sigma-24 [Clostridium sp. W14A]QNK40888.1 sigma-70 family RNA polymerase sigma factor [Caproicibacter fermentans]